MTRQEAFRQATREAIQNNVRMVVVDDPIANAEEADGPFGYCPAKAKDLLYRHGQVVATIKPTGVPIPNPDYKPSPADADGGAAPQVESELTAKARKALPKSSFVYPGERKYPIPDKSHARNALARVAQNGTPAEKERVRAAVHRKFPGIGDERKEESVSPRDIELLHLMLEADDRRMLEAQLGEGDTVHAAAAKMTGPERAALHERFSKRMILHSLRAFITPQDGELLG